MADEKDSENMHAPLYKIELAGSPSSCLIKIEKQNLRALVDSGAEISLMHARIYKSLKQAPKLMKKSVNLQSVNGSSLSVLGYAEIDFKIKGVRQKHAFFIVDNMNRNLILGRDWMISNGVRIYFDLGCLRIGKTYAPLEEDIHVASIARLTRKTLLKPQTSQICWAKVKNNSSLPPSQTYQVSAVERGYISTEPGLMVANSLGKLNKARKIPVFIVNNTNKTFNLRKGSVVGKITSVDVDSIAAVDKKSEVNSTYMHTDINVPPEHRDTIAAIIEHNIDLFAAKDSDLGCTTTTKMKIDTGNEPPIKLKSYKAPLNNRKIIDQAVGEMLDAGVIRRSRSPWSFPVVIVAKKDNTKRFCVDFRQLNRITKKNSYPLPVIDEILALLGKAKYFTTLDLKSGYWQVSMNDDDREKTAFTCHAGLFEFNVMPFGLANAPSIFQELMSEVLQGFDFCFAYIDDILIHSTTLEEHIEHLQKVFDRLRQHGLKLKLKKCSFVQKETNYLGFVINEKGIKPDLNKVEAIRKMQTPTMVKHVRSFIGMCSYYRRFLPNFSEIAAPLVALTKKHARFSWTTACQTAFDALKSHLTNIPLLAYPDLNKPYVLYTDASDKAIGACLTQPCDAKDSFLPNINDEVPIHFISHKLSDTQTRWSTIEKEAFAIHFALQRLDHYLHNAQFVIRTDHKPLKYLLEAPMQNKKIQLWALGIAGYNCTIEYIAGKDNTCADLLSRPVDAYNIKENTMVVEPDISDNTLEINAFNSNGFCPKEFASYEADIEDSHIPEKGCPGFDIIAEQNSDTNISALKTQLAEGKMGTAQERKHILLDNILYYISSPDDQPVLRLYIPQNIRDKVLTQFHDKNGHMGIDKTFDAIASKYYWPNLYKEIADYTSKCITCQQRCLKKQRAPMQETDNPPYPFAKVGLDLSGPYPLTLSGNKYIATFVDWYSGWPEAFPIPDKTGETIAHLIIEEIFPRYGACLQIVTDNGTEFENRVVKETLETLNISHVTTSFYHPQSNAKVERFHRTLNDVLSKMVDGNTNSWDLFLNQALAAVRFNISESSKFSPYFLLYNRDVVLPIDNLLQPRRKYQGEETHKIALEHQHKTFMLVHRHLKQAKRRQTKYADKKSKSVEFSVGDPVYYKNYQKTNKLQNNWRAYFRIIEQKGPVSFIIKDQLSGRTIKAHAEQLRLADIAEWEIPSGKETRVLRKTTLVVPPEVHDSESSEESEADEVPLQKVIKRRRQERYVSSDEDDIPLMELSKRLKERDARQTENTPVASDQSDMHESEMERADSDSESMLEHVSDDQMSINALSAKHQTSKTLKSKRDKQNKYDVKDKNKSNVKDLLLAVANFLN